MANKKEGNNCSFCGRHKSEVSLLIAGVDGYICESCVDQAALIVNEEVHAKSSSKQDGSGQFQLPDNLTPQNIKTHLDTYVIGQNDAKKYPSEPKTCQTDRIHLRYEPVYKVQQA